MEQLQRSKRYLSRIRSMYHGVALDENKTAKHLDDDVISFFIHCYHIRDWIIHLNKLGIISKDVDDFINQHDALKICADFANGAKHCKLIRNTRTDGKPHIAYKKQNSSIWYSDNGGTGLGGCCNPFFHK